MVFSLNDRQCLDWKLLEPGERILITTQQNSYEFEMCKNTKHLLLTSDLSPLSDEMRDFIKRSRDLQEVYYDQDIEIEDMRLYFYPGGVSFIGPVGYQSQLCVRFIAKAPCAKWERCATHTLSEDLIVKVEPVENPKPADTSDDMKESA